MNAVYDVKTIFHMENLESLGLQIFSRILIEDGESGFNFGRIAEPIIVGHKWSPIEESTRDCYLGVLINTGEVLILKRDSLDANEYEVKFRSFTCLLDQMNIPQERLTSEGDIILGNDQYLELRITDFEFAQLPSGQLIVSLAHGSGEVSIHTLEAGLPLIERFQCGGSVVKQSWSETNNSLYYALNDNSVHKCPLQDNGRLKSPPTTIKDPSRFLVSHFKYSAVGHYLVLVDTTSIYFIHENGDVLKEKLLFRSTATSLSLVETENKVQALIAYESGHVCMAELSGSLVTIDKLPSFWQSFINKTLYKYQLLVQKEKDKAPSKVFLSFLSDTVEANLYNYGTQLMASNGTLVTVYSLAPRNTVQYEIRSRKEFTVSFLSMKEVDPNYTPEALPSSTSLSKLNSILLTDINSIPAVSGAVLEGKDDAVTTFLDQLQQWKSRFFPDLNSVDLSIEPFKALEDGLNRNFRESSVVSNLQALVTANVSILKTLHALKSSGLSSEKVDQQIIQLAQEQDKISLTLRQQLGRIILHYSKSRFGEFELDIDKFIILNYYNILRSIGFDVGLFKVPDSAKVTISTDICTESFEATKADDVQEDFLKYANSTTNHKWPRCDLTLIPILELTNRADQLELHNYSNYEDLGSELFSEIVKVLNYCGYSGNRTFNLKVGV